MYYFIPAWYPEYRRWYSDTHLWYRVSEQKQFDDTINQLRMFKQLNKPAMIVQLNYSPNQRVFLQKYGLLELRYWSVFDTIQNISCSVEKKIDYRKLAWPVDAEFVYSPFLISVLSKGEKIANIEFGETGEIIWIDYFLDRVIHKRYVFDDRGFLSSILVFKDGKEYYQEYYDNWGAWQIREYLGEYQERGVIVNPQEYSRFLKETYRDISELIEEKLRTYFSNVLRQDISAIVIASDMLHDEMIVRNLPTEKKVLSLFTGRNTIEDFMKSQVLQQVDLVITDSLKMKEELSQKNLCHIEQVSIFDTRLSLGGSQEKKELIIYCLLDHLSDTQIEELLLTTFDYMRDNDMVRLQLVSYSESQLEQEKLRQLVFQITEQAPESYLSVLEESGKTRLDINGEEVVSDARINIEFINNVDSINKALHYARLIVDVSNQPNLYTQIAGISTGIPQINKCVTEYVIDGENGAIISDMQGLLHQYHMYLDGLKNWNRSLVYSVKKIEEYTSGMIVDRIESLLKYE